jgi:hypothetical protein
MKLPSPVKRKDSSGTLCFSNQKPVDLIAFGTGFEGPPTVKRLRASVRAPSPAALRNPSSARRTTSVGTIRWLSNGQGSR